MGSGCAVGGSSLASRPRRELRSARRFVVRPRPCLAAAFGHRSPAFRSRRCPPHWRRLVCCAFHRLARGSAMLHVIPLGLLQTVKWHRCNCNVCRRSSKVTVGNYVRLLFSPGPAAAHRHRGLALPPPSGTAARPRGQPCRHGNFACNSLLAISNFEFISLELQRFWVLLKVQATELHAKLGEGYVIGARLGCGGVLVRDFFALLVVLVAEAVQSSPCWRKMG